MRGGIQKKGERYYAYVSIGGKKKWIEGSGRDTPEETQEVLNKVLVEIQEGTYRPVSRVRFKQFAEGWLETYAKMRPKPSTLASYKDIIEKHLIPYFGDYPLPKIGHMLIQRYIVKRMGKAKGKTVRNELVPLAEIFKQAFKSGDIKINPMDYIDKPRIEATEMEILSPEECRLFLSHCSAKHRVLFLAAILTGMRRGELLALQRSDIDWNTKQISVKRSVWKGEFVTPKTKYSVRKVDVSPYLLMELKKHILASGPNDLDLVFPNASGGLLDPDTLIKRHFVPVFEKAKIRRVRFHDLRHTNASFRIAEGQNPKYIQDQMGHASIQTTFDRYGHLLNKANPDEAKKLDNILGLNR